MQDVIKGQTWLRKGGTGYGDDQITILVGPTADGFVQVQYGDGNTGVGLDSDFINEEFDLKTVPAGVWVLFEAAGNNAVRMIFSEDQEIEALRALNEHGGGLVEFRTFGEYV